MKKLYISLALLMCGSQAFAMEEINIVNEEVAMNKTQKMDTVGLEENTRKEVAERINTLLANEYVLYVQTQKYHWNIKGKHFGPLHDFFGKQYEALAKITDEVAERALQLGFNAHGTLSEFLQYTSISEDPGQYPDERAMIQKLLDGHELIIRQLRQDIDFTAEKNDMGTNNFLSDLLEKHEKMAWMLRAHLEE